MDTVDLNNVAKMLRGGLRRLETHGVVDGQDYDITAYTIGFRLIRIDLKQRETLEKVVA